MTLRSACIMYIGKIQLSLGVYITQRQSLVREVVELVENQTI